MSPIDNLLAVILGGGRGTRLFPLTQMRSKPAVPIAGQYRLIDIPISNCINSGIFKISVLTQFNSVSLHRHISDTYHFDSFHTGWVQIWAAEQRADVNDWYQGTADAVRKQLSEIITARTDYVLILSGDHLYRCNYAEMLDFHIKNKADVTIATQPVLKDEVGRFGILKRDENCKITSFSEKPKDPEILKNLVSLDDEERPYLGSMGIYLFNRDLLVGLLNTLDYSDFGKHIIPYAIDKYDVYGWVFDDYWEDIGTIRSFYETNLMLTDENPKFDFYDPLNPIYTVNRTMPTTKIVDTRISHSLIGKGCFLKGDSIERSIIGLRSYIDTGTTIKNTIMMGVDDDVFEKMIQDEKYFDIPLGIGKNCDIDTAIIDKNARIGENVVIKPFPPHFEMDDPDPIKKYYVRDGIVIIPKNTTIKSNTVIQP